jgi:LmbE family N-acetylglucosaminyl deacetylase
VSLKIFILSPHVDDAAYGLTLSISRFIKNKLPVTIINCFTVTKWTIVFVSKDVNEISLLRQQEDIEYNKQFNSAINIVNLDLLDAPLRNGYIFRHKPLETNEWKVVDELKNYLEKNVEGVLLCPLAIGDHVDHVIAREAVVQLYKKMKVIFFEDLPYTARIPHEAILEHVKELEEQLGVKLTCYLNSVEGCSIDKEQAIRVYKSQLNDEICSEILAHMNSLTGERLWGEQHLIDELKNEFSC